MLTEKILFRLTLLLVPRVKIERILAYSFKEEMKKGKLAKCTLFLVHFFLIARDRSPICANFRKQTF